MSWRFLLGPTLGLLLTFSLVDTWPSVHDITHFLDQEHQQKLRLLVASDPKGVTVYVSDVVQSVAECFLFIDGVLFGRQNGTVTEDGMLCWFLVYEHGGPDVEPEFLACAVDNHEIVAAGALRIRLSLRNVEEQYHRSADSIGLPKAASSCTSTVETSILSCCPRCHAPSCQYELNFSPTAGTKAMLFDVDGVLMGEFPASRMGHFPLPLTWAQEQVRRTEAGSRNTELSFDETHDLIDLLSLELRIVDQKGSLLLSLPSSPLIFSRGDVGEPSHPLHCGTIALSGCTTGDQAPSNQVQDKKKLCGPRDNYMYGEWREVDAPFPYEYHNVSSQCWAPQDRRQDCGHYAKNFAWSPTYCRLLPFSPCGFCRVLAGRRVLIVGDSQARELWVSLCRNMQGSTQDCFPPEHLWNPFLHTPAARTVSICEGSSLTFVPDPLLRRELSDWLPLLAQTEVVIFGVGVHAVAAEEWQANVWGLLDVLLPALRPDAAVFWKVANRGNPDCHQYKLPFRPGEFDYADRNVPSSWSWGEVSLRNQIARQSVAARGVYVVDVEEMLQARGDAHVGWDWGLPDAPYADCLHFQLPGPVDSVVALLYTFLADLKHNDF